MRGTKKLLVILMLIVIAIMLSACGRKGNCESCGQYEKLKKFVYKSSGETHWYCDTCYNISKLWYN